MTSSTALIISPPGAWRPLALRPIRRWDRFRARLWARRLDADLATGAPPESSWLRAVRAAELVTPDARAATARAWQRALARAAGGPSGRSSAGLRDPGAVEAAADLHTALLAAAPPQARGVAAARVLLTDGTGPLYRPQSPEHLSAALRAATHYLDLDASGRSARQA